MAIIRCKMCGGDLNIEDGMTIAECEYCGSKQTVPNADNEKKLTLFARANRLRVACEFDKAAGVYESIVADFPEEAEAYWGMVLCRYGIEYVGDPVSGKKVPTCHRSSFESIMEDADFNQACKKADVIACRVYRDEAKQLEEIRKGIIEISGKEVPYDIFICYKETADNGERTVDSVIAQDVYNALTDKGYRVFFSRISLEDKLGVEYEPYIFAALNSAKIMLAFGTNFEYYNAVWVKNEWSRFLKLMAADKSKHLIPCFKGIDAYDMPKEFAKLQAQDMGKVGAMQDLLRGIEKILPKNAPEQAAVVHTISGGPNTDSLLKRALIFLEDSDWQRSNEYCDMVLDLNPECADAYLGKLMAELHVNKREDLKDCAEPFEESNNYKKVLRFGDAALVAEIELANDSIIVRNKECEERRIADRERKIIELKKSRARILPAAGFIVGGFDCTIGLKSDGTVVTTESTDEKGNYYGLREVSCWRGIIAITSAFGCMIGLRSDGTVVATEYTGSEWNYHGQDNISDWHDIIAISGAAFCTIGLKSDGTVVATEYTGNKSSYHGQDNVSGWRDIVAIAAGEKYTAGLKSDGTVVATEYGEYRDGKMHYRQQGDISAWHDIVAIAAAFDVLIGLKSDGTVVAANYTGERFCNVPRDINGWHDIISIVTGNHYTIGLKSDGTVVATEYMVDKRNYRGQCEVSGWRDIVAIAAGYGCALGLKSDGTVVATEYTGDKRRYHGQCEVNGWKLFNSIDTLEEERNAAIEATQKAAEEFRKKQLAEEKAAEEFRQTRIAGLNGEATVLKTELANLKGLFTGKRRKEIEVRLAEIDAELE